MPEGELNLSFSNGVKSKIVERAKLLDEVYGLGKCSHTAIS